MNTHNNEPFLVNCKICNCFEDLNVCDTFVDGVCIDCVDKYELKLLDAYEVLEEVQEERDRQDKKWGGAEHDDQHLTCDFSEFIDQRCHWIRSFHTHELHRSKMIQIAALAVAAVESIDRKAKISGQV